MYIKYILVLFSFFVFLSQNSFAEYKETNQDAIKALIEKVKTVEPSQRRVVMNELKVMLRSMHKEARTQVMLDLRRSFSNNRTTQPKNSNMQTSTYHQSSMSMTESKHMQEHMSQSTVSTQRPPGQRPVEQRPPVTRPSIPSQQTDHTPMRGM